MATDTPLVGVLTKVDITNCVLVLESDDGKQQELEFEVGPQAVDYYLMTGRRVQCDLENGSIKKVSLVTS